MNSEGKIGKHPRRQQTWATCEDALIGSRAVNLDMPIEIICTRQLTVKDQ